MKNMNIVFGRIRPDIKLHHSDPSLKRLDDRNVAAVAAELVSRQVRVVAGVDEIVGQRSCHILMNLIHQIHAQR